MRMNIIKIGNSKGIRLPQAVLKQCGIDSKVDLEIQDDCIIIKPVKNPREGWAEAFKLMHKRNDDELIVEEEIDNDVLEEWDDQKH